MSAITATSRNGTSGSIVSGPKLLQTEDFFVKASILHPIVIGSIAVSVLFLYLRLGSNRSIAPLTVFDWVINVALGSTLAGIVNGTALVRGLIALAMLQSFQYLTSFLASHYRQRLCWLFQGPPLVVCFRGRMLTEVMQKHRLSSVDIYSALRAKGILNACLVECMVIEPNGNFSIFEMDQVEKSTTKPETLMTIPAYAKLCAQEGEKWVESEC